MFFGRIEKFSKSGKFADDAQVPKVAAKKKFASKMRSIVSAVKVAQRLEVRLRKVEYMARAALAYHLH